MAAHQHRGQSVLMLIPSSASHKRNLMVWIFLFASIFGAHASAFRKWSGYTPAPVSQRCAEAAHLARVPIGMWGCTGEQWDSTGPLTDFAFAGYGAGLDKIPELPVTVDVKRDFQAVGDGKVDDSAAVLAALKATEKNGGVIYFPPGKYLLTNQLNISSNQVLRGAGRDSTNLFFNVSLQHLYGWGPNWKAGMEKSPYTWAGALISTQREKRIFKPSTLKLGDITRPAARGDTRVYIGNVRDETTKADTLIVPGQWIALTMTETGDAALAKSLCNNRTEVGARLGPDFGNRQMFIHMTRVTAVGPDWVDIERPLHADIGLQFEPSVLRSYNFKVTGVGVEDLQIEFPWTPYLGHHEEPGYNAIEYEAAVNSWVRRVRILNADSGIKIYSSIFNTVSDVEIGVTPKPRRGGRWFGRDKVIQQADKDGHMAIALHWASFDNLVEKFNITALYYHELLVAGYSAHNVFHNGTGADVCLDHHGGAPHSNLWTDIDLGSGQAAMRWSGAPDHYPFAGSNNVFWNIWASKIPLRYNYVRAGMLDARGSTSSRRVDMYQSRRMAKLPVMSRPAKIQGYGQVVVDMPLSNQIPPIKEAGDWLIWYKPSERVWPPNLFNAMRSSAPKRLTVAPAIQTLANLTGQRLLQQTATVVAPQPSNGRINNAASSAGTMQQVTISPAAVPHATNSTTRNTPIAGQHGRPLKPAVTAPAITPATAHSSSAVAARANPKIPSDTTSAAAPANRTAAISNAPVNSSTAPHPQQQRPVAVAAPGVVAPSLNTAGNSFAASSKATATKATSQLQASTEPTAPAAPAVSSLASSHAVISTMVAKQPANVQQQPQAKATAHSVTAAPPASLSNTLTPHTPSTLVPTASAVEALASKASQQQPTKQQQTVAQVHTAGAPVRQGAKAPVLATPSLRPLVVSNNRQQTQVKTHHFKQQEAAAIDKEMLQQAHKYGAPPPARPLVLATPAHRQAVLTQHVPKQQQQHQQRGHLPVKPAASL